MKNYTPAQLQRIYLVARNAIWRYKLDQYEDEALKTILSTLKRAMKDAEKKIDDWAATQFRVERAEALLAEFDALTVGARLQLADQINDVASHAGEWSTAEHVSITSFGGLVAPFNNVALSAGQFREFFGGTPLGGRLLSGWVDAAFDSTTKAALREALNAGVLMGEGYPALVKRAMGESQDLLRREAVTLARTYVQSANVAAQEAVYAANADIVQNVEWCATLEPGYMETGRGTCPRCAALDGQQWALDAKRPDCPLHPRCRCILLPVLKSWRELGIDLDEMKKAARPYTMRPDKNIDTGGRRDIIEHGFHDGDYGSWWSTQSRHFQNKSIGEKRAELVRSGRIGFHDLVDDLGNLRTLKNIGWGKLPSDQVTKKSGVLGVKGRGTLERVLVEKLGHLTRRGLSSVTFVDEAYFMATDSRGKIYLSTREYPWSGNFCPSRDLEDALRLLGTGEKISFNQEYAMESFWHELNHNRQVLGVHPGQYHIKNVIMETVNQWVSRRTYQEMLDALGGFRPQHQAKVISSGYGYAEWVGRLDELIEALKIKDVDVFDDMYKMLLETQCYKYQPKLADILSKASGVGRGKIEEVLGVLNKGERFQSRLRLLM